MKLRVRLFAAAKELAGRDEVEIDVLPGATIAGLQTQLAATCPELNDVLSHSMWAVDAAYADADTHLNEKSTVALIPPVSGG